METKNKTVMNFQSHFNLIHTMHTYTAFTQWLIPVLHPFSERNQVFTVFQFIW